MSDSIVADSEPRHNTPQLVPIARGFHAQGVNVLPLSGKQPAVKAYRRWHTARQSIADLERMRWGRATGVGAITGDVSGGLACLDFDAQDTGALHAVLAALGLPDDYAWIVRSGSGRGFHLWVIAPGLGVTKLDRDGTHGGHIELRYNRHQTVLPPSVHPDTGNRYAWAHEAPNEPPAVVTPEALHAAYDAVTVAKTAPGPLPRPAAATTPQGDGSKWLAQAIERGTPGNRNATGHWLACQLRDDGLPASDAESLMQQYQRTVAQQGDHAYTEAEARATLRSAYSAPPRDRAQGRGSGAATPRHAGANGLPESSKAPEPPDIDEDTAPADVTRFPRGVPYTMHKRIMNAHYQTGVQSQHPAGLFYILWHELAGVLENGFTLPEFEAATQTIGRNVTRYTLETGALQAEAWGFGELCEKCNHTYCGTEVSMVAKFAKLPGRPASRVFRFYPADVALRNFMSRFERLVYEHAYRDTPADVRPDYAEPELEPEAVEALNALRAPIYAQHAQARAEAWAEYERVVGFLTADAGPIERDTYRAVTLPPGPTPNAAAFRRLLHRALVPEEGEREEAWRDRYEVGVSRSTLARIRADNGVVTVPRYARMKLEQVTRGQILGGHADGTVTVQLPSAEKFPSTEEEQRAAEQQSERQRRNRAQREKKFTPEVKPDPLVIPRTYTEAHLLRQFAYTPGHEDIPRYDADGEVYSAAQRWHVLAEYTIAPPSLRERAQLAAMIAAAGQTDGKAFLVHSEPREREYEQEEQTTNAEAETVHAPADRTLVSASAAGPAAAPAGAEYRSGGIGAGTGVTGRFTTPVSGQRAGDCEVCGAPGRQDCRGRFFCEDHYALPPAEKDRLRAERGHKAHD